jgi:hypothetical protein
MLISAHAVATPKQIRELMKVDGLTNDEVKSHLQVSLPPNPNCPNTAKVTSVDANHVLFISSVCYEFLHGDCF